MSMNPSAEPIDIELFSHLVQLAALELTAEEADYLRQQLNKQMKAINELAAIPLSEDTPITSHGVPYTSQITPPIRTDEWIPSVLAKDILDQAPEAWDGYVIVPDIPHTELE